MRLFVLSSFVLLAACGSTSTSMNTCSPATCAGCCSSTGQCVDGSANDACGSAGLNCDVCAGGQVCTAKRCERPVQMGPVDAGNPIVAPVETWAWTEFPTSACGNGAPTGVGLNFSTRSKDVLLYLMGGGACWNALSCQFAASNISTGYTGTNFAGETALRAAPFQRTNASNPFKDMSYVFVPYCTGDVHAGDNIVTYPSPTPQVPTRTVHHKGRANMQAFLTRLKDTFPDAERIFLSGSSAGAFGAQLNYELVAATWPNAQVHVLADCGQMINPSGTLLSEWTASWKIEVPADCTDCATDFTKFPPYLFAKHPDRRFGLLAYTQDGTLRQFFGYDAATFQVKTLDLSATAYDGKANAKYFIVGDSQHVMLDDLFTLVGPSSTPLLTWTTRFVNGDAAWVSVKP